MIKTVLLVVRDVKLRKLLASGLESQVLRVISAGNPRDAIAVARREMIDVILVNILGMENDVELIFSNLRKITHVPLLLLTTSDDESGEVAGMAVNADDYVIMPVGLRELAARINTVHRRALNFTHSDKVLRAGNIYLDPNRYSVHISDMPVRLTPIEFHLLKTLMLASGRALTRSDLLSEIQPISPKVTPRSIDVHVRNLRAKLGKFTNHYYIETVYGVGYRLSIPQ